MKRSIITMAEREITLEEIKMLDDLFARASRREGH